MLPVFCRVLWSGGKQEFKPILFYNNCSVYLSGKDSAHHPRVYREVPHNKKKITQLQMLVGQGPDMLPHVVEKEMMCCPEFQVARAYLGR